MEPRMMQQERGCCGQPHPGCLPGAVPRTAGDIQWIWTGWQQQSPGPTVSRTRAQLGKTSWFSIISKIQPLSMQGATSHAAQHPWGSPLIHTGHGSTDPSCRGSSPRVPIKAAAFLANIDSGSFSVNLCLIPIKSFGLSPPAGQGAVKQA